MTDAAAEGARSGLPSWATPEVEERVQGYLDQMTLDEKIAFVTGEVNWNYGFYARPLERLPPARNPLDGLGRLLRWCGRVRRPAIRHDHPVGDLDDPLGLRRDRK